MLLLARDAAEWWDRLPSKDSLCEPFLNGYATSGPVYLPALHEAVADRDSAYQRALYAFAEKLGVAASKVIPNLEAEHFGRPLYLQMAALLALHGERPTTAEGLTKALLNHEVRYWRGLLAPFGWAEAERLASQLLALATLAGGFATPREARPYWATATANGLARSEFDTLFHTLAPLYPGRQGLQAVRPDLLGEALVAQALLREGTSLLNAVLAPRASQAAQRHALTVLSRVSAQRLDLHEVLVEAFAHNATHALQNAVVVATETLGDLPRLVEQAFGRLPPAIKSQVAGVLSPLLHEESVQLAELDCVVSEYLVEKSRHKQSRKALSTAAMAEYAQVLANHAIALARAGRDEAALEPARQAVEIYRRLAQTRPDRYEPDYARSLSNYATHLGEVGQSEPALEHAEQSLEIYQHLAAKRPEKFDYVVINTACLMQFLSWVCARTAIDCALSDPDAMPPTIRPHRRPQLELYAAFVRAYLASEEALRKDAFKRVQSAWGSLTVEEKMATRAHWLCAAAWSATHAPDGLEALDWQTQWQSFVTQRKGHVPLWMIEVARRLSFRWPQ